MDDTPLGMHLQPLHDTTAIALDDPALPRTTAALGYVFRRAVVEAEAILALRREVTRLCEEARWLAPGSASIDAVARPGLRVGAHDDAAWLALQGRVALLSELAALREHPAIARLLHAVTNRPVAGGRGDVCRVVAPGFPDLATPPHQDMQFVRAVRELWTVWVPLGDCPRVLGGLAVLPASHRAGLRPHGGPDANAPRVDVDPLACWATADYRCGDVLAFHGLTVHRALENRSGDRLRLSVDFRYAPSECGGSRSGW